MKARVSIMVLLSVLLTSCALAPQQQWQLNRRPDPGATRAGMTLTENGILCRYSDGSSRDVLNRGSNC